MTAPAIAPERTVIVRSDGKPYRPRKPPIGAYLQVGDYDGVVLIWRTHDVAAHQAWAERLWLQATGDSVSLHGSARWVRLVPWDASGHGGDSTWIDCDGRDRRAIPAVEYRPARVTP